MLWTTQQARLADLTLLAAAEVVGAAAGDLHLVRACPRCGSDAHGRPMVLGGPSVHVSLSRAHGVGLAALSPDGPVGVDVEPLPPPDGHSRGDLARWVRVEALLKLTGTGLTLDPVAIDTIEVAGVHRIRQWPAGSARPEAVVVDLDVGPDHLAAVAVPDRGTGPPRVTRWAASGA